MLPKREVLEAIKRQRARTIAFARELKDEEWETIVLPGWRTRELIGHLTSTDNASVTLRLLKIGMKPTEDGGLQAVEAWNEKEVRRFSDRPIPELIDNLEKWGRRLATVLKVSSPIAGMRIPMAFGKVSLTWLAQLRMYDEFVHEQDLRRALGRAPEFDTSLVRAAAAALLDVVPYQTPARIAAGATGRVALRLNGLDFPPLICDLATKQFSSDVAGATATVFADPPAAMMIAAGRDAWRDAERDGLVRIEGDRAAAEAFLDALRAA